MGFALVPRRVAKVIEGFRAYSQDTGLPWWLRQYRNRLQCRRPRFDPWVRKIPWRREWLPTPVFLPGELCGQRSLAGNKESDTTQHARYMSLTLCVTLGK